MTDRFLTGRLLVSAPALRDGNFDRTIVLMLDHDADGALGVILNRPTATSVAEVLPDWHDRAAAPKVVFHGGPVADGVAIGIARLRGPRPPDLDTPDLEPGDAARAERAAGWSEVFDGIGVVDLTGDADAAVDLDVVRVFSGYAGWSSGQLEGELALGAWFVVDATPADVLDPDPDRLWARVLRRQEGDLALLALYPADPSLN